MSGGRVRAGRRALPPLLALLAAEALAAPRRPAFLCTCAARQPHSRRSAPAGPPAARQVRLLPTPAAALGRAVVRPHPGCRMSLEAEDGVHVLSGEAAIKRLLQNAEAPMQGTSLELWDWVRRKMPRWMQDPVFRKKVAIADMEARHADSLAAARERVRKAGAAFEASALRDSIEGMTAACWKLEVELQGRSKYLAQLSGSDVAVNDAKALAVQSKVAALARELKGARATLDETTSACAEWAERGAAVSR